MDLPEVDTIVGTSGGAVAAVALARATEPDDLFAAAFASGDAERPAAVSDDLFAAFEEPAVEGGADLREVARRMGRVARRFPEPIPRSERHEIVEHRLGTSDWPSTRLRFTAIDVDTGELHLLDQGSGVPLVQAAAASGAIPGVWPMETFDGRAWMDGGMISTTNAGTVSGHDAVVILAPRPSVFGSLPDAFAEALRAGAAVSLLVPDDASNAAIGTNALDPARRHAVAAAGRDQGRRSATSVAQVWSTRP